MPAALIERETVIGAVVVAIGVGIMAMAYGSTSETKIAGYNLTASFTKAEGINTGAEVRLAGVTVGKVVEQKLDPQFRAQLTLRLAPDIKLPRDSAALIETDGLLGPKFVALQPGADDALLQPGATLQYTQSSMNVTDILQMIISQAKVAKGKSAASAATNSETR